SDPKLFSSKLGNNPYDNPTMFRAIPVGEGKARGYFSVIAPYGPDDQATDASVFRYGAVDEAGKINVNALLKLDPSGTVAQQILTNLGIPDDVAAAILDWLDPDDTPRQNGAENEYYSLQGYSAKNGPLDTLEELLYVRGVTPQLLFGNDFNRNGVLDPAEQQMGSQRDLGWAAYLTVYSRELNVDAQGNPR